MTLAIKCILICHLALVMFLHYLTIHKNRNSCDELKQRLIDTWYRISQGIIDEATNQWQTWLHACVKAKGRHFDHLL